MDRRKATSPLDLGRGALRRLVAALLALLLVAVPVAGCSDSPGGGSGSSAPTEVAESSSFDLAEVPSYTGSPSVEIDGNEPDLTEADADAPSEAYSELDELGRCGATMAVVGEETMPTEDRESIGMVKPTGWHTARYDGIIADRYLYNRCHLIGFQLTGENANERNLITGTRYMNVEGMLPYEEEVADYVHETGNHVIYRVTPVFVGDELVARGVHMEALSVEDGGEGVSFNVFCYNVQPGISIDYATGESREESRPAVADPSSDVTTYVLNTNTRRFHLPDCPSVEDTREENRDEFTGTRDDLVAQGYEPCGRCQP